MGFRKVIDAAIEEGGHGVAMFGLASEYPKPADAEKVRLARIMVEQTDKRVPVIVSMTHHSLDVARKEAAEAMRIGTDALMIMPPFFRAPNSEIVQNQIAVITSDCWAWSRCCDANCLVDACFRDAFCAS